MTTLLEWRHGQRSDRAALQSFTCTVPARKIPRAFQHKDYLVEHPRPWEQVVQSRVRGSVHHPPCKDICYFLLGCDDAGRIGAAVHFSPIDGLSLVRIDFLAVECRFRGQGGAWAAEALDYVLDEITLMAVGAGVATTLVVAEIHAENTASQRLFGSNGFTLQGPGPQDYELWAIEFVHPTVDDV